MTGSEWSLVFFTLFAQAAWGMMIALAVVAAGKKPVVKIVYANTRTLITGIALILMLAALIFSFFHLGSPLKSVYALSNINSSWLSREILMVSVFCALLLVWYAGLSSDVAGETANRYFLWISIIAGTVMVFSMARLYMMPTIPAWDSALTMVLFYSSGLLLGIPLVLALILPSYIGEEVRPGYYSFIPVFIVLIVFSFLMRIIFDSVVVHDNNVAFPLARTPLLLIVLHYIFSVTGIGLLIYRILVPTKRAGAWRVALLLSLVLILTGEIIGRYIFYAGYFRTGV